MKKINVLVVPSDNQGGVGFYRSSQPHIQLEKQFPEEFSVTFNMHPDWANLTSFDVYDIIHVHKGLFRQMEVFRTALKYFKKKGIVTIMDIDDHWKLNPHHPQYVSQKTYHIDEMIRENLRLFDYVTTTTPIFAKEIEKYNKNVFVIPNAIDPDDPRFAVSKKPSKFIRIGLIMGSSHEHDVKLIRGLAAQLGSEIRDKVQFVLCGYDLRGTMKIIDPKTGKSEERPIQPMETVWYRYEKQLTENYSIVSPEYKNFLHMFIPNVQYPNVENEHYKRCWTKDMDHYYQHYSEVDVLLAPIETTEFNLVKSQLKAIECCFSHTALIASDYGPYQIDLVNAIEKGNVINPNGNALLVDEGKNHKQWCKFIKRIVNEPELLEQLKTNIYETLHDKFDLKNVTADRAKFYKACFNESPRNKTEENTETQA